MIDKIIISDTSCLIALERINQLHILHQLFSSIFITKEVKTEFGKSLPHWIIIQKVQNNKKKIELQQIVDEGEASAIALALEIKNCLLIINEKKGRKVAQNLHIKIAGTLQILVLAKSKGLISSLAQLLSQLEQQNFRFTANLKEEVLKKLMNGNGQLFCFKPF